MATIEEEIFVDGLKKEGRVVTERSIMRLEERISRLEFAVRGWATFALQAKIEDGNLNGEVTDFLHGQSRRDDGGVANPAEAQVHGGRSNGGLSSTDELSSANLHRMVMAKDA